MNMDSNYKELYMYVDKYNNYVKHIDKDGKNYVPLNRVGEVKKIYKCETNTNIQDYYDNPQDYIVEEINGISQEPSNENENKYKLNVDLKNEKVYMYVDRYNKCIKEYWTDRRNQIWIPVDRVTGVRPIFKIRSPINIQDYYENPQNYIVEHLNYNKPVRTRNRKELRQWTELHNGDNVKLMRESHGFLYVTTHFLNYLFTSIQNSINNNVLNFPSLETAPKKGDLVAAFYSGEWFRAVVSEIKDDQASIIYIDYGYEDKQDWNDFRILPRKEQVLPLTLFKIKLKGFSEFSAEALDYLKRLKYDRTELTVGFDGEFVNGVHLFTSNGLNIGKKLMELNPVVEHDE